MALINKTGITNGGTIEAEHITRAIDALSGVGTDSIIASGSFTGALTGTASFATTASFALNAGGSGIGFPFTGSARITGSLIVTGSATITNAVTASGGAFLRNAVNVSGSVYMSDTGVGSVLQVTGSSTTYITSNILTVISIEYDLNTEWYSGNLVYGDCGTINTSQQAVFLKTSGEWEPIDTSTYDPDFCPMLGICLERNVNGVIILDGFLKATASGSVGTAPLIYGTLQKGLAVWVDESTVGRLTTTIPTGGQAIRMGYIYEYTTSTKPIILRIDPTWVRTI
jgi:hypothetical protein